LEEIVADLVIGVLALQGDVREHLTALAECDVVGRPVRRPGEVDDIDALVIPGGESTTMSKLAVAFEVYEPIKARIAAGMPTYGSCAGMIMLADEVLDGRPDQRTFGGIGMTVRRNAFGRQVDSFESRIDVAGVDGGPVHAVFIRAPWVEKVSETVTVLGRVPGHTSGGGADGATHAGAAAGRIVAVRQGHLLATSFHPELTGDLRVHQLFVNMVRELAR
jgi:pyridoxal 5'-phosphate synthase pdxT subunit